MQIIALRNINPNEEILTSYIDTTLPKYLRQKSLKETYNFECRCTLCTSSLDLELREAVFCPKQCGGTCPIPLEGIDSPVELIRISPCIEAHSTCSESNLCQCSKCRAVLKDTGAIIDAVRVGQEGLDKATALQSKDPYKSLQLTTNLIPILISSGLTPSSHPLLALSRLHQSLLIESLPSPPTQESLDDAIRATTRSSAGLSAILPYGHPIRGITLAELGKLLAVDEPSPCQPSSPAEAALRYPPSGPPRLKLALETMLRARNELLVGFGAWNEGGQVGKDAREVIVALEKEMMVWKQGVRNVLEDTPRPVVFKS
ncbi:Histone-lysine N-methyltransferase ASHR1 [Termitomyces sp. T112]|nr:Histone-lysine N-methyltransferase ASHR1 [Termitomyces sp. T112]